MITPFSLPSNPDVNVQLREATVADAIDFADVDDSHEEELTTMFLNRMQEGHKSDSKKWTAADRRFALYWYFLHTANDLDISLSYDCQYCGQRHIYLQNLRELADKYVPLNGDAKREMDWKGEQIVVHPLLGADIEVLERMRLGLSTVSENSVEYKKKKILMEFERLMLCFSVKSLKPDQIKEKREKITALSVKEFSEFSSLVKGLLEEMRHGLEMEYDEGRFYLVMPEHECPNTKGGKTRLRYLFRNIDYIPKI